MADKVDKSETLIDYLDREQRTFDELAFNPVDSLVLSSLCYCNFEIGPLGSSEPKTRVPVEEAITGVGFAELLAGTWMSDQDEEMTRRFIGNLLLSRRYHGMEIAFYAHSTIKTVEKQFSATTFFLPNKTAYLAFRGTDGTLAGWKEDFNLCFMSVVPSQTSAQRYLSGVASSCDCPLILGGHSKGGNLAEYAALCADDEAYARIKAVYNHDGPSFMDDPSPRIDEKKFQKLLHKTVPESSVFGMILERRNDYRIVQSNAFAIMQHAPFSWIVKDDDFVYAKDRSAGASFFDSSINEWCASFTPEERGVFIDAIYSLITDMNITTAAEFSSKLIPNLATMLSNSSKLDDNTRKLVIKVMGAAFVVMKDEAFDQVKALPMRLPKPSASQLPATIKEKLLDPFLNADADEDAKATS